MENIDHPMKESMLLPEEETTLLKEENEKLKIAYKEILRQNEEYSKMAYFDKRTGLKSPLALEEELKFVLRNIYSKAPQNENRQEKGDKEEICLIFFDLDHFKNVNDTYGHDAGNEVLAAVGNVIQHSVRESDIAARWGGEEIVVVMDAPIDQALTKADEIRQKISDIKFEKHPELVVTVSAGVARASDYVNQDEFFEAADQAMYQSKKMGRNRVTEAKKEE